MTLKDIKQQFFAYRNGALADTLRKAGMPYGIIFGLNIPQLAAIARQARESAGGEPVAALADELWADRNVRESRLLACYLFDADSLPGQQTLQMMADVQTREEADILAFRLLRYLPYAAQLAVEAPDTYVREALRRNLAN